MVDREVIAATEAQWFAARTRMKILGIQSAVLAITLITGISIPASFAADHLSSGVAVYPVTGLLMLVAALPLTALVWRRIDRQQRLSNNLMRTLRTQLKNAIDEMESEGARRATEVHRQDFERSLHSALEMSEDEPEVVAVIERALQQIIPDSAAELLLADNSHAHLIRVASASPTGKAPGCAVSSPDHCPAARHSQVQRFLDSDALDACPKLRSREQGRSSAVCVPVSIMGRAVGVLHAAGEPGALPDVIRTEELGILADKVGGRVGMLRVIAESQLQASTDSLTGLLNRRSMQNKVREMRRSVSQIAVIVADLDNFKDLNDTFGHETGDRALRLFASTLSGSLRREDLVSRHGGEEFVAVLPRCSGTNARKALESVRTKLAIAVAEHGLPPFTCSFGITDSEEAEDLPEIIARADMALFEAKRTGRDRAVLYDPSCDMAPIPLIVASRSVPEAAATQPDTVGAVG